MNKLLLLGGVVLACVVCFVACAEPDNKGALSHYEMSLRRHMEKQRQKAKMDRERKQTLKIKKSFRPSSRACCKLGERAARKKLSCSVDVHRVSKNKNLIHRMPLKMADTGRDVTPVRLMVKMAKCGLHYSKYFEKCCHHRVDFERRMDKCRRLEVTRSKDSLKSTRRLCKRRARRQKSFF